MGSIRAAQRRTTLVVLLGLALVVAALVGPVPSVTELAGVSLLALAIAGALALVPCLAALTPHAAVGVHRTGDLGPPVLRTRTTDPTHQPRTPRAPGRV